MNYKQIDYFFRHLIQGQKSIRIKSYQLQFKLNESYYEENQQQKNNS